MNGHSLKRSRGNLQLSLKHFRRKSSENPERDKFKCLERSTNWPWKSNKRQRKFEFITTTKTLLSIIFHQGFDFVNNVFFCKPQFRIYLKTNLESLLGRIRKRSRMKRKFVHPSVPAYLRQPIFSPELSFEQITNDTNLKQL